MTVKRILFATAFLVMGLSAGRADAQCANALQCWYVSLSCTGAGATISCDGVNCVCFTPAPCNNSSTQCSSTEFCDSNGTCKSAFVPCNDNRDCPDTRFGCNANTSRCAPCGTPGVSCPPPPCTSDQQCSDGNACNGIERCQAGRCVAGVPKDCNDNNPITADYCSSEGPDTAVCSNVAPNPCAYKAVTGSSLEFKPLGSGARPGGKVGFVWSGKFAAKLNATPDWLRVTLVDKKGNPLIDRELKTARGAWKGSAKRTLSYKGGGEVRQITLGPPTDSGRPFRIEGVLGVDSLPQEAVGLGGSLIVGGSEDLPQCGKVVIPLCDPTRGGICRQIP